MLCALVAMTSMAPVRNAPIIAIDFVFSAAMAITHGMRFGIYGQDSKAQPIERGGNRYA